LTLGAAGDYNFPHQTVNEVLSAMDLKTGQRYVAPGGAELIVSKASTQGDLTDGDIPLQIKGANVDFGGAAPDDDAPEVTMGKRLSSPDGSVSVLVTKAGKCDLRIDGEPMELQEAKQLPSSD
jgi:hypothetical protein